MNTRNLPFEIKSIADSGVIEGVISAFGGIDAVGDTIQRGAYTKSLGKLQASGRALPVLYQHDTSRPIGVWKDLAERPDGLVGKADLALEVGLAQEALALAKKGALTGISIGFEIPEGGSKRDGNRRILTEVDLWEASLVTFPADPKARVTSVKDLPTNPDEVRELLRDIGFSGRDAAAMAGAWKSRRNGDGDEAAAEMLKASIERLSTKSN